MNSTPAAPPALRVTHLATTATDGAGTAAWRQHEALLECGVASRFLSAYPRAGKMCPETSVAPPQPPNLVRRLRNRLPVLADSLTALQRSRDAAIRSANPEDFHELFSLPFSRCRPEDHPWLAACDVVHLHWIAGFVDFPRFFAHLKKPLVWTLHDQQPYLGGFHYARDRETAPSLRTLDDQCRLIKQAALAGQRPLSVVGNSRWNTAAAAASGFFPAWTRFETIYYPLHSTQFSPRDKPAAKTALGLPTDRCVVGFASTDLGNHRKGLGDLMAALALLQGSGGPPLALLSFGREPDQASCALTGLPWLHLGFLDSEHLKSVAYSAMDVFVIPSRAEAFGQTAIEAMACGTAVIGSHVDGLVEALDDGRCGLLFEPGNVADLAGTIRQLAADPTTRQTLASTGRAHVVARHAPAACARRYLEVYADTLQASHSIPAS